MKKFSKLLVKNNLTPKERVMTLIKSDIHYEKTGERILSESDIYALSEQWSPTTNIEVEEYNKYWHAWDNFVKLGMDMQTIFFTSLLDLSEIEKILILFFFREDVTASKQVFEKNNNEAEQAEVRNYFLENTGIEYKNLVHRYAFNSLSKLLQQDMELLHPEVQYDSSYFNEEEELAKVLEGKTELTQQDIEKLTNLIICSVSWGDQDLIKSRGMNYYGMIFNSYYAGIPLKYFGQLLAKERNLEYKDDKQLIKELSEIKNLRAELRRIVVDSIKNGLFENEYIPLCNSDTYKTYSGKTKQKHNVIFKQWIKAKQKAVVEIQKHIKENDLIFEERKEQIYEFAWTKTIVTGTSLYYADESISFVKEYKEQIEILLSYGMMLRVLEARDISEKYSHLLRYNEVAEKMSKILNEDATYTAEKYLDQIQENIMQLNQYIAGIKDKMFETVMADNNFVYAIEMFFDDLEIDLSSVKPQTHNSLDVFEQRAKKYLGLEWSKD